MYLFPLIFHPPTGIENRDEEGLNKLICQKIEANHRSCQCLLAPVIALTDDDWPDFSVNYQFIQGLSMLIGHYLIQTLQVSGNQHHLIHGSINTGENIPSGHST
jgi:hypothetical protein